MIPSMVPVSSFTISNSCLKFSSTCSTSPESAAMVSVVFMTSASSSALTSACSTDSWISVTISSISPATFCTCVLMSVLRSMEDIVLLWRTSLFRVSSSILLTTESAPCRFSSASSRTTVTPSTIELLAPFTCPTVVTTRLRLSRIDATSAPSDSFKWSTERT